MQVRRITIKNFRSIIEAELLFDGHTVLVGGNSVGKSTICEALDLTLGPDRLNRIAPVDEHDFHSRRYLDDAGEPILIEIEVVLTNLDDELKRLYASHLEFWSTKDNTLLNELNTPEDIDREHIVEALRIGFRGNYEKESDEFQATTYFLSPPSDDIDSAPKVRRLDKQKFGFIYLRSLRTGARALSLERGSLFDIVLRLNDGNQAKMWEETIRSLATFDPPIHGIPQLKKVLDEIENRVGKIVGLPKSPGHLSLYPSSLTRESLRKQISLFGSSDNSDQSVPFGRLGSGVINSMVFSLLTFIADNKKHGVIFAMEELETAIPPHTQRNIVQYLQNEIGQTILTTHSAYVLEQFPPENIVLLNRNSKNELICKNLEVTGIKVKAYRGGLRMQFAEAILGRGVICVEGVSDRDVLQTASYILNKEICENDSYVSLDCSGISVVQCGGEGDLLRHGRFFKHLGLKTYAFFDKNNNKNEADFNEVFVNWWDHGFDGIESLLLSKIPINVQHKFLQTASDWEDYPNEIKYQLNDELSDTEVRDLCFNLLKRRKAYNYAARLVGYCTQENLPTIIKEVLYSIHTSMQQEDFCHPEVEEEATENE